MLKKLTPVIVNQPVEIAEPVVAKTPPYVLANHTPEIAYWHLVTNADLLEHLKACGAPNLVSDIQRLDKEVTDELRAISNKVRLVSREPYKSFDLCDSLVAQRFVLSINTWADEYISYSQWLLNHFFDFVDELNENQLAICEHASWFSSSLERENIAKDIAKILKVGKATILSEINGFIKHRDNIKEQVLDEGEAALPAWLNNDPDKRDFYWRHGWVSRLDNPGNTGIYFSTGAGPKQLTNFVLIPLIHVYTQDEGDNRRFTELNNGMHKPVLQLPGKAFTSMEVFETMVSNEGNFWTGDGFTKSHLNKLKMYYLGEYPKCFELKMLGWQPEGFFSFSNMIYKNQLIEYNQYGYAAIDNQNYLSMGASNALEGVRSNDDIYKNDKYLCYRQSPVTLEKWCALMVRVYGDHGMTAVLFAMMSIFRDILFKRNNNFPMLYFYGPVGSGKSKIAESVANFFTHEMPMFNLSNGTDFSFFNLMERFGNVAACFNEFDENTIRENWFTAFKGAFDGEGRNKGSGKKNKSITQSINIAIVLIGQFLSTKDDNSVLIRTIPCKITGNDNRTVDDLVTYNELKSYEKQGLSSLICDVLDHRQFVGDNFLKRYVTCNAELKAALRADGVNPKERVLENYSVALTMCSLMSEKFMLGFTYDKYLQYCKTEVVKIGTVMSESNALSQFWKTVEFLVDQGLIEQGDNYRIETLDKVRISVDRKKSEYKVFDEPKKLLFLRLSTVHMLYMKEVRTQTGKQGQNEQTIITYMKDQDSYIGSNPGSQFANTGPTSSYVFDYDLLGANLERLKDDNTPTVTLTGKVHRDAVVEDVIGVIKLRFTLLQDESFTSANGDYVSKLVYTNCTSNELNMNLHLKAGLEIKITGPLDEKRGNDKVYRSMAVNKIEIIEAELPLAAMSDDEVESLLGKGDSI